MDDVVKHGSVDRQVATVSPARCKVTGAVALRNPPEKFPNVPATLAERIESPAGIVYTNVPTVTGGCGYESPDPSTGPSYAGTIGVKILVAARGSAARRQRTGRI